jgi:hypothetical protein
MDIRERDSESVVIEAYRNDWTFGGDGSQNRTTSGRRERPPKLKTKERNMDLPKVSQEPIIYVDATPDKEYPLRILQAHRGNCNCKWVTDSPDIVLDFMNKANDQRAEILDKAIAILEKYLITGKE